ncbi:MAG: arsenate reductase (glutaredoxin) [Sagittula sp.]|uniref:arsenate reductase (glutaredoxin) n=1 Tax=unclassified Sagittula TaxID=2624628 RepID=UPI0024C2AADE|nr:arsenate reductase (glutaredoxin) [Sagittula sp. MA-2]WHZ35950.1 arsenate reductase (glutaredoxin) [Sagittula sp. MA-2]
MAMILWHNPRCSKSREALKLLEDKGYEVEVFRYLDTPPSFEQLESLHKVLGVPAIEMVRTKEAAFREHGLSKDDPDEALLNAMVAEPKLIERPILVRGNRAVIGRPPERVLDLAAE